MTANGPQQLFFSSACASLLTHSAPDERDFDINRCLSFLFPPLPFSRRRHPYILTTTDGHLSPHANVGGCQSQRGGYERGQHANATAATAPADAASHVLQQSSSSCWTTRPTKWPDSGSAAAAATSSSATAAAATVNGQQQRRLFLFVVQSDANHQLYATASQSQHAHAGFAQRPAASGSTAATGATAAADDAAAAHANDATTAASTGPTTATRNDASTSARLQDSYDDGGDRSTGRNCTWWWRGICCDRKPTQCHDELGYEPPHDAGQPTSLQLGSTWYPANGTISSCDSWPAVA